MGIELSEFRERNDSSKHPDLPQELIDLFVSGQLTEEKVDELIESGVLSKELIDAMMADAEKEDEMYRAEQEKLDKFKEKYETAFEFFEMTDTHMRQYWHDQGEDIYMFDAILDLDAAKDMLENGEAFYAYDNMRRFCCKFSRYKKSNIGPEADILFYAETCMEDLSK